MAASHSPRAGFVIIGNEILSGRTQDANLPYLAQRLGRAGIAMVEVRIVSDERDAIIEAVNTLRARLDHVFTSGGIGPTHDDITAASIAAAFDLPLDRDPEAVRRLERHYPPDKLNAARLTMADVPRGAGLIDNPVSAAPGFRVENVYVLAGVPAIFRAMVDMVVPHLAAGPPILSRTLSSHLTEGLVAAPLGRLQEEFPDVAIGSYPFYRNDRLGVSLVLRSPDPDRLEAATAAVALMIRALGEEPLAEPDATAEAQPPVH
ncbi:MAG: competence/damage-inducible protein A [Alphaproteobacteria bacterium]|jgi:molybdenum cofactor synthesis domain-containing protein|nr:competence/damage-inducible protein A [Alphaproteobacteria bacterium]